MTMPRIRQRLRTHLTLVFLILGALLVSAGTANASIMLALDLPDLVKQADHIAVVDVASVRSDWDEKHERIYSTIELSVVETWKSNANNGSTPTRLTIVQAGGTVGDMSMVVMGMSTFVPGTRSLVFLRGKANRAQVVGMAQGLRPLSFEAASKRWMVSPPSLSQVKLVRATGSATTTPATGTASQATTPVRPGNLGARMELDAMKSEVMKLVTATTP